MYLQAAGGAGYLQMIVEIDRATAALPEWQSGASIRVEFGPADATTTDRQVEEIALEAGKRTYAVRHPARDLLPPGRYQVRAQAKAARRTGAAHALDRGHRARRQRPARLGRRGVASRSRHRTPVRAHRPTRATAGPNAWWSRRR